MNPVLIFLFSMAGLVQNVSWAHSEVHLEFPLNIACEQIDNKLNGWTAHHLFSFQKDGNENADTLIGHYKGYETHAVLPGQEQFAGVPTGTKEMRGNETQGSSNAPLSMQEGIFPVNAVGFMGQKDNSGVPFIVVGSDVSINSGETTEMHSMVKGSSGTFVPRSYNATCRKLTAEEFKKL